MSLLYDGIEECAALIIDGNPTSRSIMAGQLRDFGVGQIVQTSRPQEARKHLEKRSFDIVLCDYHFDQCDYSGQDLLDDLRRSQLLPYFTTFVMVTGEASYTKVAEAAESALDSYLIKPYAAAKLGERLQQARTRKTEMRSIFRSIEDGDLDNAAGLCVQRYLAKQPFAQYAARIGGELLLRQGHHAKAQALYQKVLQEQAGVGWARLGLARTYFIDNNNTQARKVLDSLLAEQPAHAEGHDLMGRIMIEQGDLNGALESLKRAVNVTPSSITRCLKLGALSFYMASSAEACRPLERATALGGNSKMFDAQALVLLAFLRYDQADFKGLRRCHTDLMNVRDRAPDCTRTARMVDDVAVLMAWVDKLENTFKGLWVQVVAQIEHDDLDVEAACNLLGTLARMPERLAQDEATLQLVDQLAWRFCGTRTSSQLMIAAASPCRMHMERVGAIIKDAQTKVQEAMSQALQGEHRHTVVALTRLAEQWRNAKWMDMAAQAVQRHQSHIEDADALADYVAKLRDGVKGQPARLPLVQESSREIGALSLRVNAPPTTAVATV